MKIELNIRVKYNHTIFLHIFFIYINIINLKIHITSDISGGVMRLTRNS